MATNNANQVDELLLGEEFEGLPDLMEMGERAVPRLTEVLSTNPDELMRKRAAIALGRIGALGAREELVARLRDESPVVVISVIEALAELGDEESGQEIAALLSSPDASVRLTAARALGKLRIEAASTALHEFVQREDLEFVREAGYTALAEIQGTGEATREGSARS